MAKLQLALDGQIDEGLAILKLVHQYIDIIEVGTPLILREGVRAIQAIQKVYPELEILADFKIMDAGYEEARIAFSAGATMVTVLGVAHDSTIESAVQAAKENEAKIVIDMMRVPSPIERTPTLLEMGCDIICFHTAFDVQGQYNPLPELISSIQSAIPDFSLAIAGGIKPDRVHEVLALHPDILVVGGGITRADNPMQAAKALKEALE